MLPASEYWLSRMFSLPESRVSMSTCDSVVAYSFALKSHRGRTFWLSNFSVALNCRRRAFLRVMFMCAHMWSLYPARGSALEIVVRAFLVRRRALEIWMIGVHALVSLDKSRRSAEPHQAC